MKRLILLSILALVGFGVGNVIQAQQPTFLEVRLAETAPASGLTETIPRNSDRPIYLHDMTLITNSDVVQARVVENDGRFNVAVTLTAEAAMRMAAATSAHTGKPIAMIVNGEIIAAPTVRGRIGEQVIITGNLTRAEAELIASGLRR